EFHELPCLSRVAARREDHDALRIGVRDRLSGGSVGAQDGPEVVFESGRRVALEVAYAPRPDESRRDAALEEQVSLHRLARNVSPRETLLKEPEDRHRVLVVEGDSASVEERAASRRREVER